VEVITALVAGAALLLLAAGATKVADPSRTTGALAALGWPSSRALVRGAAAGEAVVGAATLIVGGRLLSGLVAVSYAGFAVFVLTALRSGAPIGTCGCFGRPDTRPTARHVAVDAGLAATATVGAVVGVEPLTEATLAVILGSITVALAAYALLTHRSGVSRTEHAA
jgi:hypothetical protein